MIVLVFTSLVRRKDVSTPAAVVEAQTRAVLPFPPMIAADRDESLEFRIAETLIAFSSRDALLWLLDPNAVTRSNRRMHPVSFLLQD